MVKVLPDKSSLHGENLAIEAVQKSFSKKNFYCLYSLAIDENNTYHEIDLVLITDKMVICFEVKGSKVIECNNGVWNFSDSSKSYLKNISPLQQSQNTVHPLKRILKERLPPEIYKKLYIDWGVIFPRTNFNSKLTPEAVPERICDLNKINDFEKFVVSLQNFSINTKNYLTEILNPNDIKKIVNVLRPNIKLRTGINFYINQTDDDLILLEDEQKNIYLDIISEKYPQNIIKGGPGSGKTFLAVELSKKLSENGKSSALFCFNKFLANNIRKKLSEYKSNNTKVFHIHEFMYDQIKRAGNLRWLSNEKKENNEKTYYSSIFPEIFKDSIESLYQLSDLNKFDHIIIDEGQDFLDKLILDPILTFCINGKQSEKNWTIFLDDNVQKEVYGHFNQNYMTELEKENQTLYLTKNYRNPQNFISKACEVAGIKDKPISKRGLKNILNLKEYTISNNNKDLLKKITNTLNILLKDEKVQAQSISILVPNLDILNDITGLKVVAGKKISNIKEFEYLSEISDEITVSTVSSFKGLENQIIILVDNSINNLSQWQKSIYYVGMTRALTDLYLFIPTDSNLLKL